MLVFEMERTPPGREGSPKELLQAEREVLGLRSSTDGVSRGLWAGEGTHWSTVLVLLTWSCLNSSQLLRTNASLLSDQHTEKANVCVRKGRGEISFSLCQLSLCIFGDSRCRAEGPGQCGLPGVGPFAPGLQRGLILGVLGLP